MGDRDVKVGEVDTVRSVVRETKMEGGVSRFEWARRVSRGGEGRWGC